MAVSYSNQVENHRGVYFEAVGDGSTTALTVSHKRNVFTGTAATATVTTGPFSGTTDRKSDTGGFFYPAKGTAVAVTSVSVTATTVTVHTQAAVSNGVRAKVAVVFNQPSSGN